jgi:hypothetical protein
MPICPHQAFFWHHCREIRRFLQGESRTHILYFVICFALLNFCLHRFIKNTKKISFLIVVILTCLLLALLEWVLMRTPSCVILLALIIVILSALLSATSSKALKKKHSWEITQCFTFSSFSFI